MQHTHFSYLFIYLPLSPADPLTMTFIKHAGRLVAPARPIDGGALRGVVEGEGGARAAQKQGAGGPHGPPPALCAARAALPPHVRGGACLQPVSDSFEACHAEGF